MSIIDNPNITKSLQLMARNTTFSIDSFLLLNEFVPELITDNDNVYDEFEIMVNILLYIHMECMIYEDYELAKIIDGFFEIQKNKFLNLYMIDEEDDDITEWFLTTVEYFNVQKQLTINELFKTKSK